MKDQIAKILYKQDIMHLRSTNANEYAPEANAIYNELLKANYSNKMALARMIHKVFVRYFGEFSDEKGNRILDPDFVPFGDIYIETAKEILRSLLSVESH